MRKLDERGGGGDREWMEMTMIPSNRRPSLSSISLFLPGPTPYRSPIVSE
jgi:hypothetical protein